MILEASAQCWPSSSAPCALQSCPLTLGVLFCVCCLCPAELPISPWELPSAFALCALQSCTSAFGSCLGCSAQCMSTDSSPASPCLHEAAGLLEPVDMPAADQQLTTSAEASQLHPAGLHPRSVCRFRLKQAGSHWTCPQLQATCLKQVRCTSCGWST